MRQSEKHYFMPFLVSVLRILGFIESCFLPLWNKSQKRVDFKWDNANISNLFIEKNVSLTFSELMQNTLDSPFHLPYFYTADGSRTSCKALFVGSTALQ